MDGSTRVRRGGRAASSTLLPTGTNWNVWDLNYYLVFLKPASHKTIN